MKKSRTGFYVGLIGIVIVVVVAVVAIMATRGGSGSAAPAADGPSKLTCYGGSEKADFINDPDVKKILRERFGIEVDFIAKGSYKQVQIPPDELKADNVDCLWPSSASAQAIFEGSGSSKSFGNSYEAASVLQSPEVLYANEEAANGLRNAASAVASPLTPPRLAKPLNGTTSKPSSDAQRNRLSCWNPSG